MPSEIPRFINIIDWTTLLSGKKYCHLTVNRDPNNERRPTAQRLLLGARLRNMEWQLAKLSLKTYSQSASCLKRSRWQHIRLVSRVLEFGKRRNKKGYIVKALRTKLYRLSKTIVNNRFTLRQRWLISFFFFFYRLIAIRSLKKPALGSCIWNLNVA